MKKILKLFLISLSALLLVGCALKSDDESISMRSPKNKQLEINGTWKIKDYIIKDSTLANNESIKAFIDQEVVIKDKSIVISGKEIKGVKYKVKIVDQDYIIGYSPMMKLKDLGIFTDDTRVYTVNYQNNIFAEIIKTTNGKVYLDYSGVLYSMLLQDENIDKSDVKESYGVSKEEYEGIKDSEGVYVALKNDQIGKSENYRTLWISLKNGELQESRERENIIFPRMKGIWEMKKNVIDDKEKDIYYEYFDAHPIDSSQVITNDSLNHATNDVLPGEYLERSINFIGNDYMATETIRKGNFVNSPVYEVLPIDNLNAEIPIVISDIYPKEINKVYENTYNNVYSNLGEEMKSGLSRYINYSNFTLVRNNGKWVLEGRISSVNNGEPYDYPLSIAPNKKLLNYDTLIIPWNNLKARIPFIKDAFISPNGNIAIVIIENELQVYKIYDGNLDVSPVQRIKLNEGEKVIMAEWCTGDYVDKWGNIFKENSKAVK